MHTAMTLLHADGLSVCMLRGDLALLSTPCEMNRGAPGLMRKRRETSYRVYACHRFTRSQLSVRCRAQRRAAVATLNIVQFFSPMFQLDDNAGTAEGAGRSGNSGLAPWP